MGIGILPDVLDLPSKSIRLSSYPGPVTAAASLNHAALSPSPIVAELCAQRVVDTSTFDQHNDRKPQKAIAIYGFVTYPSAVPFVPYKHRHGSCYKARLWPRLYAVANSASRPHHPSYHHHHQLPLTLLLGDSRIVATEHLPPTPVLLLHPPRPPSFQIITLAPPPPTTPATSFLTTVFPNK
jgi:hypothetical protein